jgi:predicted transcriptional regulator of viral defense system
MKMQKGFLNNLLRSKQTVFSFKELMLLWDGIDAATARARVHYYVKNNDLYHLRRGLYAKDSNYDKFELATKIYTPSYISFETVLGAKGITFQHYNRIFIATYQSKEVHCDNQTISFKTVKTSILTDPAGIENREVYSIASLERAFLDVVYLHKDYYFDNLSPINWDKVYGILPIYGGNKQMEKRVRKYHEAFKQSH